MKYETPEMKVLMLEAEDVITLSEGTGEGTGTDVEDMINKANETSTTGF